MKWTSECGPRVTKLLVQKLRKLESEIYTSVEVMGVIGGEEYRHVFFSPFQAATNTVADLSLKAICQRFDKSINNNNRHEIEAVLDTAIQEAIANRLVVDKRRTKTESDQLGAERETQYQASREKQKTEDRIRLAIEAKRPSWARAVIIAEWEINESDSQTDYFGTRAERRIAIGWRSGQRESFKQLREVAAQFPDTAHLGPDAPKEIEHRDNFSMGGGNYLKAGSHYSTGWLIYSRERVPNGVEDGLPVVTSDVPRWLEPRKANPDY